MPPAGADVAGQHGGVQAVLGVVDHRDGLVVGAEACTARRPDRRSRPCTPACRGDPGQHGRLDVERPDLGTGTATGQHLRALADGVVDVRAAPRRRCSAGDRAIPCPRPSRRRAAAAAPGPGAGTGPGTSSAIDSCTYTRSMPIHSWPGVGEAGPLGDLGGSLDVGVRPHDERVLAAQFQRATDQPFAAAGGDPAADRGGAGEHHVVRAVDQPGPAPNRGRSPADIQALGQPGRAQQVHRPQRGHGGLDVGAQHHRVPGQKRRQGIGDSQRDRVVPRRDRCRRRPWRGGTRRSWSAPGRRRAAFSGRAARARSGRSDERSGRSPAAPRRRPAGPCRSPAAPGRAPRPAGRAPGRGSAAAPGPARGPDAAPIPAGRGARSRRRLRRRPRWTAGASSPARR